MYWSQTERESWSSKSMSHHLAPPFNACCRRPRVSATLVSVGLEAQGDNSGFNPGACRRHAQPPTCTSSSISPTRTFSAQGRHSGKLRLPRGYLGGLVCPTSRGTSPPRGSRCLRTPLTLATAHRLTTWYLALVTRSSLLAPRSSLLAPRSSLLAPRYLLLATRHPPLATRYSLPATRCSQLHRRSCDASSRGASSLA